MLHTVPVGLRRVLEDGLPRQAQIEGFEQCAHKINILISLPIEMGADVLLKLLASGQGWLNLEI